MGVFGIPWVEVLGLAAGFFTAFSSIPQTYKIVKLKQAESVSLLTYVMLNISCILWLIYGITLGSVSIVFWNVISISMTGTVIVLKLLDMRKNK
jgi:MtN3 and saliva related transmembrane protein